VDARDFRVPPDEVSDRAPPMLEFALKPAVFS
jgi:hypothetical protein